MQSCPEADVVVIAAFSLGSHWRESDSCSGHSYTVCRRFDLWKSSLKASWGLNICFAHRENHLWPLVQIIYPPHQTHCNYRNKVQCVILWNAHTVKRKSEFTTMCSRRFNCYRISLYWLHYPGEFMATWWQKSSTTELPRLVFMADESATRSVLKDSNMK